MTRGTFGGLGLALVLSLPVLGNAAEEPAAYFDGPAGFLLTRQEAEAWRALAGGPGADAFVELFWARRDPDLATPANELRDDFQRRVEAADTKFGFQGTRGALSDRGRMLLLLGKPHRFNNSPAGAVVDNVRFPTSDTSHQPGSSDGGVYGDRGATEIWEYEGDKLPVRVGQEYVYAVFRETRTGMQDYVLDRSDRRSVWVLKLLTEIPEALLVHPELNEVPRIGLLPGAPPATAQQLAWLDAAERPWPEGAALVAVEGLIPGPRHFAWAHVRLPLAVAPPTLAVGRLRDAATGREAGTVAAPVAPFDVRNGRAVELAVPLAEGRWRLELALAAGGAPIAVASAEVETTAVSGDGTAISPFCWGAEAVEVRNAELGDPFNVGGWHVAPTDPSAIAAGDSLNYMCYVLGPDSDTPPELRVTLTVSRDGKQLTRTPARLAELSKLGPGLWLFGSSIPVAAFRDPGAYVLAVSLRASGEGPRREVEIPFAVR